jgi:hypothetical protein
MNAIGVWLGYGLFRIFIWLYLAATQRFSIEHSGFPAYIYEIALQTQLNEKVKNA